MTTVAMTKDGNTIRVASSQVSLHQRLGWSLASVSNSLANVDVVIGAEDTNVINVALQLQDANGAALAQSVSLNAFLTDAVAGIAITAAAPSGGVAAGTNGGCIALITNKLFLLSSDTQGRVDINITEATAKTWYLVIVFPNGARVVSDAITFAA